MTNENKNIYWNAACMVSNVNDGACSILSIIEDVDIEFSYSANIFSLYFKPTYQEEFIYSQRFNYWMSSYNQTSEQNQLDRFTALLFMHEIYNDPDFVENPHPTVKTKHYDKRK